jgi:hypothetical protein
LFSNFVISSNFVCAKFGKGCKKRQGICFSRVWVIFSILIHKCSFWKIIMVEALDNWCLKRTAPIWLCTICEEVHIDTIHEKTKENKNHWRNAKWQTVKDKYQALVRLWFKCMRWNKRGKQKTLQKGFINKVKLKRHLMLWQQIVCYFDNDFFFKSSVWQWLTKIK